MTGIQSTEISTIYVYLATLIFLMSGAHQFFFASVFNSFSNIPMGLLPSFDADIVSSILRMSSQIFIIAFGIALPVFSVLLICDMLLGLMSKMMPHMNIYMVALPVKIYIALFLLFVFLGATSAYLTGVTEKYIKNVRKN